MKKIIIVILAAILWLTPAQAEDIPKPLRSYELFKHIPVLDAGRIKPLDTFARNILLQFSGKDTYDRRPAIEWFARLLFAPGAVKDDKVFLINNPDIATALGIEPDTHRRYSFAQLQKSAGKLFGLADAARHIEQKQRSIVEAELIRVYDNLEAYAGLTEVMAFSFPHDDFTVQSSDSIRSFNYPSEITQLSFLDVALHAKELHDQTSSLVNKTEASLTASDKDLMKLLRSFVSWSSMGSSSSFALIPHSEHPAVWISPFEAILKDFKSDETKSMLSLWQNMAAAFWNGDQVQFDIEIRRYLEIVAHRLDVKDQKKLDTFSLEIAYHRLMPFLWARIFYILAFICFVASLISTSRWWYTSAFALIVLGFLPHFAALVARIIIMARPPVTSLYETFIFCACICVALGIWIERVNKQWMGILVAAISGSAFLFIASRYSSEGDTMQMLVAVLNSNFWLATHVTTITMGYAATCVAGVLGHIWLIQACFKREKEVLKNTYQVMMIILGISLALTFLGTNLGGIWADQSWGRFWGWDPKENGALMIVLWTAMLFHFKIAKMIGPLGMAVGVSLGVVVVMWAWFGVNLLSIGLHSYGFTSGIANALLLYLIIEIIFLGVTSYFAKKNA